MVKHPQRDQISQVLEALVCEGTQGILGILYVVLTGISCLSDLP